MEGSGAPTTAAPEGAPAVAQPAAAGADARPWQHQWTLEELRDNTRSWNLACDYGMLTYLQGFSTMLLGRTRALQSQIDGLGHQAKAASANVHNTFNQFLMLSNTQFIENRVYEFDATTTPAEGSATPAEPAAQEAPKEPTLAELVPKYSQAVTAGLAALKFHELGYPEEEPAVAETTPGAEGAAAAPESGAPSAEGATSPQASTSPVAAEGTTPGATPAGPAAAAGEQEDARPRFEDPYSKAPLPHIIGTAEFLDDDAAGLFVEESEESEAEAATDSSFTDSEGEEVAVAADGTIPPPPPLPSLDAEVAAVAAERAAHAEVEEDGLPKIVSSSSESGEEEGSGSGEEESSSGSDLFAPEESDGERTQKRGKVKGDLADILGEHIDSGNIFGDDDGEDLFVEKPKPKAEEEATTATASASESVGGEKKKRKKKKRSKKAKAAAAPPPPLLEAASGTEKSEGRPDLPPIDGSEAEGNSDSEPKDLRSALNKTLADQLAGRRGPPKLEKKHKKRLDDERAAREAADSQSGKSTAPSPAGPVPVSPSVTAQVPPVVKPVAAAAAAPAEAKAPKKPKSAVDSLFDDEDDTPSGGLFEDTPKKAPAEKKKTLLFEDDDDDALFDTPKPAAKAPAAKEVPKAEAKKAEEAPKPPSGGLFGDDDVVKPKKSARPATSSLFDDEEDALPPASAAKPKAAPKKALTFADDFEEDEVPKKEAPKVEEKKPSATSAVKAPTGGLFGDDEPPKPKPTGAADLFGDDSTAKVPTKPKPKPKGSSLFFEEEVDEKPAPSKAAAAPSTPPKPKASAASLFGEEDVAVPVKPAAVPTSPAKKADLLGDEPQKRAPAEKKPDSAPLAEEPTRKADKPAPEARKETTKKAADLFGEDDDFLAPQKAPVAKPAAAPLSAEPVAEPKKSASPAPAKKTEAPRPPSGGLFGDDGEAKPKARAVKKPGALFNDEDADEAEGDSKKADKAPAAPQPSPPPSSLGLPVASGPLDALPDIGDDGAGAAATAPPPKVTGGKIADLQKNLKINPLMMVPGARPPRRHADTSDDEDEDDDDLDTGATPKQRESNGKGERLECVNKSRARAGGRRPPTRRPPSKSTRAAKQQSGVSDSEPAPATPSKPAEKKAFVDPLFGDVVEEKERKGSVGDSIFDGPLFDAPKPKPKPAAQTPKKVLDDDDIAVPSKAPAAPKVSAAAVFDDPLFAPTVSKQAKADAGKAESLFGEPTGAAGGLKGSSSNFGLFD
eukprot:m51a1_g3392 hypothetical protein (1239) ;mRNA; r:515507-519512